MTGARRFSFTCDKCGDPVPLPELYHMPVFITCRAASRVWPSSPQRPWRPRPPGPRRSPRPPATPSGRGPSRSRLPRRGWAWPSCLRHDYAIAHHLMMNRLPFVRALPGRPGGPAPRRAQLETRAPGARWVSPVPRHGYVSFMGGLGRSAQILGQEGLDDRRRSSCRRCATSCAPTGPGPLHPGQHLHRGGCGASRPRRRPASLLRGALRQRSTAVRRPGTQAARRRLEPDGASRDSFAVPSACRLRPRAADGWNRSKDHHGRLRKKSQDSASSPGHPVPGGREAGTASRAPQRTRAGRRPPRSAKDDAARPPAAADTSLRADGLALPDPGRVGLGSGVLGRSLDQALARLPEVPVPAASGCRQPAGGPSTGNRPDAVGARARLGSGASAGSVRSTGRRRPGRHGRGHRLRHRVLTARPVA